MFARHTHTFIAMLPSPNLRISSYFAAYILHGRSRPMSHTAAPPTTLPVPLPPSAFSKTCHQMTSRTYKRRTANAEQASEDIHFRQISAGSPLNFRSKFVICSMDSISTGCTGHALLGTGTAITSSRWTLQRYRKLGWDFSSAALNELCINFQRVARQH